MAQRINNAADASLLVADLVADLLELFSKEAWNSSGIGYATGAGGAITQATSKSTAVTLNKNCGRITTHNESLAAGATVAFTLNNSNIAATDVVVLSLSGLTNADLYRLQVGNTVAGAIGITLTNLTGSARAEAVTINFAIIKVVTS